MTKHLNQFYFYKESKRMHYVLGASYAIASIQPNQDMTFTSSHRNLVEIVKDELECPHKVQRDKRGNHNSYWIELDNMVYMASKLEELGVAEDKIKRRFPENIREEYLSHFVRGFFDAKAIVHGNNERATTISINFNNEFLSGLHNVLVRYAYVGHAKLAGEYLEYTHNDALRIHNFIYKDWKYIKSTGLYIPSKKKRFETNYKKPEHPFTLESHKKMEKAKKWLMDGYTPKKIAQKLHYYNVFAFYRAFKNTTGMTTREFLKKKLKLN